MLGERYRPQLDVLVVDDDYDLGHAVCLVLQNVGHRTELVHNGKDALRRLRGLVELPDVIVLDLRMPVMNGWEFRLEQKKDPVLANIPVVAISADFSPQAKAINTEAMLSKPVNGKALIETIETVVAEARASETQKHEQLIALGHLAAGVAHEINNPLSYIMGNVRLLQEALTPGPDNDPLPPEEVLQILAETQQGTQKIAQIVRDMQVFASIRDEYPEVTDLRNIVDTVLSMATGALKKRTQIIREYDQPVIVKAPPARIAQLFLHLVLNAVDAMTGDGGQPPASASDHRLVIRLRRDQQHAIAEVSDTGRGIPPILLERIFDPFLSPRSPGRKGLGLFVCRSIVEQLGGNLSVQSALGEGSTYRVQLPWADPPATSASPDA